MTIDPTLGEDLRRAGDDLLAGIRTATDATLRPPVPGQWDGDQILGHVALVNAITLTTAYAVTAGRRPDYDNRRALDPWTIADTVTACGGRSGVVRRLEHQVDALVAVADSLAGCSALDVLVPALLVSGDTLLVDQPLPLRDLVAGLARVEWPNHRRQLLELTAPASTA